MREELNTLIAVYAWATLMLAVIALGLVNVWVSLWACAVALALATIVRIGYAVYGAGRRSADKEEK